jgi:hypothetical protein
MIQKDIMMELAIIGNAIANKTNPATRWKRLGNYARKKT